MIAGLGITFYYMATTQPWLRSVFGVTGSIADNMWWGIQPISAGLFGVPLGFAVIIIVSLLTPARPGDAGTGRARALPEPRGRHDEDARHLKRRAIWRATEARRPPQERRPAAMRAFCFGLRVSGRAICVAAGAFSGRRRQPGGGSVSANDARFARLSWRRDRLGYAFRHCRCGWRRSR